MLTTVRHIFGRIMHSETALHSQWDKGQKNNLLFASPSIRRPTFRVDFPITPHVFRHSKSMHMLQAGVNLIYIRDFLGHVDCSTTEIYARADTEMKRKAIEAAYNDVLPASNEPSWQEDPDLMNFLNSLCQRDS